MVNLLVRVSEAADLHLHTGEAENAFGWRDGALTEGSETPLRGQSCACFAGFGDAYLSTCDLLETAELLVPVRRADRVVQDVIRAQIVRVWPACSKTDKCHAGPRTHLARHGIVEMLLLTVQ